MRQVLNLNWIRSFEAAARSSSFTDAARELNMTQAGVSQHVRLLELELGEPLFHRLPRGVRLTDAGEAYIHVVRESLARLRTGTLDIFPPRSSDTLVTVRCNVGFASHWLSPRLPGFFEAHGDVTLRILGSVHGSDLVWEGVDMEIRYDPDHALGLDAKPLFADSLFPVCNPETARRLRRPADLKSERLIHVIGNRRGWNEWFAAACPDIEHDGPNIQTDTSAISLNMAEDGAGIALGHRSLVDRYLERGRLVRPFDIDLMTTGVFHLITPSERTLSPAARRFITWLVGQAEESPRPDPRCPILALAVAGQDARLAPLLVFAAGIVVQRVVALQRRALHQLHAGELFPLGVLLRGLDDLRRHRDRAAPRRRRRRPR